MDTDRNLLFGVLAMQADLITPDQFVQACTLWTSRKETPLATLLLERGWLTAEDRAAVDELLQRKLRKHQGNARASLAEVVANPVQRLLGVLNDPEVQRSLAEVSEHDGHILLTTAAPMPQTRERYTLTRLHASGGIGRVWLARDTSLGRNVALKELLPERLDDPRLWNRFLKEAQITGQLEHPAIVPVYELARRSENQPPFYTMRFVKGRTLTEAIEVYHAKREAGQAGALELSELLQAFVGVCQAVAYAHSRGVIHRDLKGQNVVLGDYGEVIVLDWGLAKLVDRAEEETSAAAVVVNGAGPVEGTIEGQVLGTPAYMAPEQAQGRLDQIDARTDVYGLGAILYEILTGAPPFTGTNTQDVLRKVCEEEPQRPRAVCADMPAALEAVCLRTLAKRPAARYATAAEVAQEVQRWLAGEPVRAYREPWSMRGLRWMRRHRALVTGTAAALLVALMALAGGLVVVSGLNRQLDRANVDLVEKSTQLDARNTELAASNASEKQARQQAETVLNYLVATLGRADPSQDGEKVTLAEVLRRSARELPTETQLHPVTRASLLDAIGRTYQGLGLYGEAVPLLEQARNLFEEHLGANHLNTLTAMNNLASAYDSAGRPFEALPLYEETLRRQKASLGPEHSYTLLTMHNLATVFYHTGRLVEAVALEEEALRLMKAHEGPEHLHTLAAMIGLAGAYAATGRRTDAVALQEEALRLMRATEGPDHPGTLKAMDNLASLYDSVGRPADALRLYEETLKLRQAKLGPDHPDTLASMHSLARQFASAGRLAEALPLGEETLKRRQAKLGIDHPDTLETMNVVAGIYELDGRPADAVRLYEETLARKKAKLGPDHPSTLSSMNSLAIAYRSAGRLADALPLFEETLKQRRAKLGPDHPDTFACMNNLAVVYRALGRPAEAIRLLDETLKRIQATLGRDHPDTVTTMNNLAFAYQSANRLADALPLQEEGLRLLKAKLGPDHRRTLVAMNNLAQTYDALGRRTDALPLYEETVKVRKLKLRPDHPDLITSMNNLATCYFYLGRPADALPLWQEVLRRNQERLGADHPDTLTAMYNLGAVYWSTGRPADALPLLEHVLSGRRKATAPLDLANTLALLGSVLTDLNRPAEGEPLFREALALREKHLPPKHWETAQTNSLLGGCLTKQQKFVDAERCLLLGYQDLREAKVPPPQRLQETVGRLVQLYTAMGRNDKAEEWRKKLNELKQSAAK